MGITEISTVDDLRRHVRAAKAKGRNVVVEFYASWCGACKAMRPVYEKHAAMHPTVVCLKSDVDKSKDLSFRAGVQSMPTFQAFVDGTRVEEFAGVNEEALHKMLTKYQ